MDWLTRLPVVGPAASWFFRTRLWHVYTHLEARKWTRLAAAVTFTSFLALFPMLAVAAAVGASFLSPARMTRVQNWMADQVPGISDQLNLQSLVDNAGTVGLIGGALLLVTGVNWASTLRETLRAVWDLPEDPGNAVLLKLKDLGVLVGLGAVGLLSVAGSAFAVAAVGRVADLLGLAEGGAGTAVLRLGGYAAAVATDFLLLWYVLTWLPRVEPPRRALVHAGLMGAVGFELLKALLGGYLQGVAAKSMYGAFGVPIALLLWISLMAKLLLFCAAWTATASRPTVGREGAEDAEGADGAEGAGHGGADPVDVSPASSAAAAGPGRAARPATDGAPGTRPASGAPGSRP
ncbi:YihY/virulence factor BrkB family protein [Streptomyces sp. TR06-5]|uniref:YihY/virulence factor BrkB family protein n=1 Tax=unclassified Streptomyces TaxID=2593676 RepID=UPI0039A3B2D5